MAADLDLGVRPCSAAIASRAANGPGVGPGNAGEPGAEADARAPRRQHQVGRAAAERGRAAAGDARWPVRPVRSSPAQPTPVTVQPGGSGHGHHSGTRSPAAAPLRRSTPRRSPGRCARRRAAGAPAPQLSQRQSVCIRSGGRTEPPQRGQLTDDAHPHYGALPPAPPSSESAEPCKPLTRRRSRPAVGRRARGSRRAWRCRWPRPALIDRVEPYWAIEKSWSHAAARPRRTGPGPSWPNSSTQRRGSVTRLQRPRAGQVVDADHRQAGAARPGDELLDRRRGGARAGSGR